jgi:hypothetical protein
MEGKNLSTKLYQKLDIKGTHTLPVLPQCNSQAEVFNKTMAKYMQNVVNESTLNWECCLAPLMFCYNISYHKTINMSPYKLTYGMKPRLPSFLAPDFTRINYDKGFVAERLKKARQISLEHCNIADIHQAHLAAQLIKDTVIS